MANGVTTSTAEGGSGNCRLGINRGYNEYSEWALSRVAKGEGALAGKFRHPAVAPHLRALQRQFPLIEQLLDG